MKLNIIAIGPEGVSFSIEGNDVIIILSWQHIDDLARIREEYIWEKKT